MKKTSMRNRLFSFNLSSCKPRALFFCLLLCLAALRG